MGGLEEEERGERDEEEKVNGSEKTRSKGKTSETPNSNRDKLEEMVDQHGIF